MQEYQISVSQFKTFLFRTDWDDDLPRVTRAALILKEELTQCDIKVLSRSKSMYDETKAILK